MLSVARVAACVLLAGCALPQWSAGVDAAAVSAAAAPAVSASRAGASPAQRLAAAAADKARRKEELQWTTNVDAFTHQCSASLNNRADPYWEPGQYDLLDFYQQDSSSSTNQGCGDYAAMDANGNYDGPTQPYGDEPPPAGSEECIALCKPSSLNPGSYSNNGAYSLTCVNGTGFSTDDLLKPLCFDMNLDVSSTYGGVVHSFGLNPRAVTPILIAGSTLTLSFTVNGWSRTPFNLGVYCCTNLPCTPSNGPLVANWSFPAYGNGVGPFITPRVLTLPLPATDLKQGACILKNLSPTPQGNAVYAPGDLNLPLLSWNLAPNYTATTTSTTATPNDGLTQFTITITDGSSYNFQPSTTFVPLTMECRTPAGALIDISPSCSKNNGDTLTATCMVNFNGIAQATTALCQAVPTQSDNAAGTYISTPAAVALDASPQTVTLVSSLASGSVLRPGDAVIVAGLTITGLSNGVAARAVIAYYCRELGGAPPEDVQIPQQPQSYAETSQKHTRAFKTMVTTAANLFFNVSAGSSIGITNKPFQPIVGYEPYAQTIVCEYQASASSISGSGLDNTYFPPLTFNVPVARDSVQLLPSIASGARLAAGARVTFNASVSTYNFNPNTFITRVFVNCYVNATGAQLSTGFVALPANALASTASDNSATFTAPAVTADTPVTCAVGVVQGDIRFDREGRFDRIGAAAYILSPDAGGHGNSGSSSTAGSASSPSSSSSSTGASNSGGTTKVALLIKIGLDFGTYCGTPALIANFTAELASEIRTATGMPLSNIALSTPVPGSIVTTATLTDPPSSAQSTLGNSRSASYKLLSHVESVTVAGDSNDTNSDAHSTAHVSIAALALATVAAILAL